MEPFQNNRSQQVRSDRITLKDYLRDSQNPQILGCGFLNVLVLIRGFLLYLKACLKVHMK